MTPSINRMISLLSESERDYVTKQEVVALEEDMINMLDFDFNYTS
jgi:hypothetical protein